MKTQVICLDSSEIIGFYTAKYGFVDSLQLHGELGVELRDVPESLVNILVSEISGKKALSDPFSYMVTGAMQMLINIAESIGSLNKSAGSEILKALANYALYDNIGYTIAGREFNFTGCYVMGILNVTPDSFSDGGRYFDKQTAVSRAMEMIEEGADIIDIGGESTRPGANPVSEEDELNRVLPVIDKILNAKPDAVISVDTTKSKVADEALEAGSAIINDISGLVFDNKIAEIAAKHNAALVVMHIKGTPREMQRNPNYVDVVSEVYDHLYIQTELAKSAGVNKIIIDPGIGFGKKLEHNFELIKRLKDFKSLGYPILIGISRKSFIGSFLELGTDERDAASSIADTLAVMNGAKIIRTHNVKNGSAVKKLVGRLN